MIGFFAVVTAAENGRKRHRSISTTPFIFPTRTKDLTGGKTYKTFSV